MLLKLEPSLKLAYVEGKFDRDLYRWELQRRGRRDITVYEICTLDVPAELLRKHNLTSGERQRLIAASKELSNDHTLHNRLMFLIDADFDYVLDVPEPARPLHRTIGSCTESLFSRSDVLSRFIEVGMGKDGAESIADKVIDLAHKFLRSVFSLRALNEQKSFNWNFEKTSLSKCFDKKTGAFSFLSYCNSVAGNNACQKYMKENLDEWLAPIEESAAKLSFDKVIHGHDFVEAIGRLLQSIGINEKYLDDAMALGRLLLASIEWEMVKDDPMIKQMNDVLPR